MGRRGVIRLRYVHSFKDKTGRQRHYFRRNNKSTPLPGLPGSREFMDTYAACLADQPPPREKRPEAKPRTFAALAILYYGSAHYLDLSQTSRGNYRRIIDHFLEKHGHRRVDQMRRAHVIKIIGEMASRPGAAITLLKRIRTLVRFAMDLEWIEADPTHKVRSFSSTELHTWDEAEIAQFEECWAPGTKQRLAFALLLYTGQRGSDVHQMTWGHIERNRIRVAQQKTGARLTIPLHPELRAVLATSERGHAAILTTAYGAPFSVKGFGNFMSDAIRAAGLPARCKAHGLRKAAARRLAEAGCSEKQIAAITGHKTLAEVERYTRAASQERLAEQAIEKQVENTRLANFDAGLQNSPETAMKSTPKKADGAP